MSIGLPLSPSELRQRPELAALYNLENTLAIAIAALLASHPQIEGRAKAKTDPDRLSQTRELLKAVERLEESVVEYLDRAYIEIRDGLPGDIDTSQNRLF